MNEGEIPEIPDVITPANRREAIEALIQQIQADVGDLSGPVAHYEETAKAIDDLRAERRALEANMRGAGLTDHERREIRVRVFGDLDRVVALLRRALR